MLYFLFHLFQEGTAKCRPAANKSPLHEQSVLRELRSIYVHTVFPYKTKKLL